MYIDCIGVPVGGVEHGGEADRFVPAEMVARIGVA
jgi:hypothetical protein